MNKKKQPTPDLEFIVEDTKVNARMAYAADTWRLVEWCTCASPEVANVIAAALNHHMYCGAVV
jgi:hypothetical protein